MAINDKKEQKAAYTDALSISPVDRKTLRILHEVNDNILDKWLYVPDRYPPFRACWELWMFLQHKNAFISRRLNRLIERSIQRAEKANSM